MYILYENEFNENVHHEQDKLIRWVSEASRLNPDVPLNMILSAAKDWVDGKKYSITTLSGFNLANPESDLELPVEDVVEEPIIVEPEIVEVIVEDTAAIEALSKTIEELKEKNTALEVELQNAYSSLEEKTVTVEEEEPVAVLPPHVTHSVSNEDAVVDIDDYVTDDENINATLTEEQVEEDAEFTAEDAEVLADDDGLVEENSALAEAEAEYAEAAAEQAKVVMPPRRVEDALAVAEAEHEDDLVSVEDFMKAQEEDGPKRSINDTVDFSKRKRGRKGSALAALANDGDDIENMATPNDIEPSLGRPDRAKRRPQRFNMTDEKQSRIRDNLVAIYSDPDALKDL